MTDDPKLKIRTIEGEAVYSVQYNDSGPYVSEDTAYTHNPFNRRGEFTVESGQHIILAETTPDSVTMVRKDSDGNKGTTYDVHQGLIEKTHKITLERGRINAGLGAQGLSFHLVFRDKAGAPLHDLAVSDEQASLLNGLDNPLGCVRMVDDQLKPVLRRDDFKITPNQILAASQGGQVEVGQYFLNDARELESRRIIAPSQHPDGLTDDMVAKALQSPKNRGSLDEHQQAPGTIGA